MQPVLSGIMEPLLKACRLSADGLDPSDGAVFMLNNIDVIREALVAHAVRLSFSLVFQAFLAILLLSVCVCLGLPLYASRSLCLSPSLSLLLSLCLSLSPPLLFPF